MEDWFNTHPKWTVYSANCADVAKCGLHAIKIKTDSEFTYSTPQELARTLFDEYGNDRNKVIVLEGSWANLIHDNGTRGVVKKKLIDPAEQKVSQSVKSAIDLIIKEYK